MTDFTCPNCRGGFPEPVNDARYEETQCPWCGQALDGEYEPPTGPISTVTTDDTDDRDRPPGVLGKLFGHDVREDRKDERKQMSGPLYQRLFGWLE